MRELDLETIEETGIPSIVLMENASGGVSRICKKEFPVENFPNLIVFAGPGNNGGDGITTGRILAQWGYNPLFLLTGNPEKISGDPKINFNIVKNLKLNYSFVDNIEYIKTILKDYSAKDTFIVDALFGTGLKNPVSDGFYFDVIQTLNLSKFKVLSVDIPSGLSDLFSPESGIHIQPDSTVTFQTLKISHLFPDNKNRCGKIFITDIGIPLKNSENKKFYINLIEPEMFTEILTKRDSGTHKGNLGHSLIIAGSQDKPGAAILSSISVLRSGAGLCTCATSTENRNMIIKNYPEIMTIPEEEIKTFEKINKDFDSILAGPGMGTGESTEVIVRTILARSKSPVILDADALNILENDKDILNIKRECPVIITPHPKEFSRVTGISTKSILSDPVGSSRKFSMENGIFTVLKGHYSVISSPDGEVAINQTGNPGMATAGSGDVLAGIISGMISQFRYKFPLFLILQTAVFIHGFAGDIASDKKGEAPVIASDIVDCLPDAFKNINGFNSKFTVT